MRPSTLSRNFSCRNASIRLATCSSPRRCQSPRLQWRVALPTKATSRAPSRVWSAPRRNAGSAISVERNRRYVNGVSLPSAEFPFVAGKRENLQKADIPDKNLQRDRSNIGEPLPQPAITRGEADDPGSHAAVMPDWSPVRTFGGYAAWGGPEGAGAWTSRLPIADLKGFFGALGCACRAVQRQRNARHR